MWQETDRAMGPRLYLNRNFECLLSLAALKSDVRWIIKASALLGKVLG